MVLIARFVDSIGEIYDPISDTFTRTVANGWGTADTGQVWTTSGGSAADYSVNGTRGVIDLASVNVSREVRLALSVADFDITADHVSVTALPTGANVTDEFRMRFIDANNYVAARLFFNTDNTVTINLRAVVGGVATSTGFIVVPSVDSTAFVSLRFEGIGSLLRAKAWLAGTSEPGGWHVSMATSHLAAGGFRWQAIRNTGNTNTTPYPIRLDNLTISSPTQVRLDLNDGTLWRLQATSRCDPPRAKRARVSTLLTDGAHYPATAYDDRVLELRWLLQAATADAVAGELQKLARELDRPNNFLEYRPEGATHSVWFRTHRLGFDAVDTPTDGTHQWVEVNVPAEPFAYGLKETLPQVTVNNDPAAVSNGMFFDVSGVKGDVETPLVMRITRTSLWAGALASAVGIRRRGTPANMPFVLQCESMTLGTDTTLPGNDAAMSGSGSNYARCSFATDANLTVRLSTALFPSTSGVDTRGTYRVFLRKRHSAAADCTVALGYGASDLVAANYFNDTVVTTGTARKWIDLGVLAIPAGGDPVYDGYSGTEVGVRGISLSVLVGRTAGAGSFDADCLLLVPADDRYAHIGWRAEALGVDYYLLDSIADMVYALEGPDSIRTLPGPITHVGGLPVVSPGAATRIAWMINAGEGNQQDSITDTTTIDAWYWPRYLYVRPVST